MIRTYIFKLNTGFANATHKEEVTFEFEDHMSEEDIELELEDFFSDWSSNFIDGSWTFVKQEGKNENI